MILLIGQSGIWSSKYWVLDHHDRHWNFLINDPVIDDFLIKKACTPKWALTNTAKCLWCLHSQWTLYKFNQNDATHKIFVARRKISSPSSCSLFWSQASRFHSFHGYHYLWKKQSFKNITANNCFYSGFMITRYCLIVKG